MQCFESNELCTTFAAQLHSSGVREIKPWSEQGQAHPYQKNIYGAALALIAIMYGIMQGIIAVTSLLATMHNPGNGMDPQ